MINRDEFEDFVFLIALENAVGFKGKANPKALLGKVIPKFPEMKNSMGEWVEVLESVVSQVNSFSLEEQEKKLLELNPDFFKKKNEKKVPKKSDGLPELLGTEKGVVVRFEPAPSGHLHLGHLFSLVANYEVKKKYGGKFILRIADTNPDNIDIKNYDKVIDDVKWMCDGKVDEIVYQSDRLDIYYKYLRQLVEVGHAYICKCEAEVFKAYVDSSQKCPCHAEMDLETQKKKLDKMFSGRYKQGEAVIRAKADIENKNPALRSFSLARINESKHARVGNKYRVWPTMHLAVAIDDSVMGISHVIRGKDHEINMQRQNLIQKALGLKIPEYFHTGRMKFEDIELSKTKISEMIKEGKFTGWDDPRVPSVLSYRRRGYRAEAFGKFILSLGISKRDSKITSLEYHKGLDFFNKQILEKESERYFFVYNPKKVVIKNLSVIGFDEIELPKHPEDKSFGNRHFKVESEYLIDGVDFKSFEKGDLIRLMHFGNFKILTKGEDKLEVEFVSKDYDKNLNVKRNIHFVSSSENLKCSVVLSDNSHLKGVCEKISNPKLGESFQFERFGFVRFDGLDSKDEKVFYFTHR